MKILQSWLLVPTLAFLSCDTTEAPPPAEALMTLEALDASCTEAWLRITLKPGIQPRGIALRRDTAAILETTLLSADTMVIDEGLLPSRSYSYTLTRLAGLFSDRASAGITTMDTTSHDFTWRIDTLADSGVLYDVAIISDTLAYAVGELYLRDSTGQFDPLPYNLAVWNGRRWDIRRLNYRGFPPVIRFVFAINENNIWFDPWFRWNGQRFMELPIDPVFVSVGWHKMWGRSNGELYVVGDNGRIAYSSNNGSTWQRLESGTTLSIHDIWGSVNQRTGEAEILCVASDQFLNQGMAVLSLRGLTVTAMPVSGLSWSLSAIWFVTGRKYFVAGDGFYSSRAVGPVWYRDWTMPPFYKTSVRGNGLNDIVVVGSFGLVLHYNGVAWHNYHPQTYLSNGAFGRVQMRGDLVAGVGGVGNRGVALLGRRL